MKLNYWIHGRMAAGKTLLANEIVGPEGITVSARGSTDAGLRRLLQGNKRIVLDEFREDEVFASETLRAAAENGTIFKGSCEGKSVEPCRFDVEVLVVISEEPPRDPALRRRFHVIEIKRAGYAPAKDAPAPSFWKRLFGVGSWQNAKLIHGEPDGSNKPSASSPLDGASCSASSRRFRCKMCRGNCRSSNQDRGKRDMCRPCEQRYKYETR